MADLPLDPALPVEKRCRACDSAYVSYWRHVPMQRMPLDTPLYQCADCGTFMHPQIYKESDEVLRGDAKWHISVEGRNQGWSEPFWDAAEARGIRSAVEIGCATGTFLSVAKRRGVRVHGYDSNPHVVAPALERHGIVVDPSFWSGSDQSQYDLVASISTFEHLTNPRGLMAEMATYCKRTGAQAFISVPFNAEKVSWPTFLVEKPELGRDAIYLCDVHLTHFTKAGFETMAKNFGAKQLERAVYGGWTGYWLNF